MDELFEQRKKMIAELVHDELYVPMKIKELAIFLNVAKEDRHELERVLDSLVSEGKLTITKKGKYMKPDTSQITGVFESHPNGFGFVTIEGEPDDVFIPAKYTAGDALRGVEQVDFNNEHLRVTARTQHIIDMIPEGGNFTAIPKDSPYYVHGMISHVYRRIDRNEPSKTIIAAGGGGTWGYHYPEPRPLTNRERARIQSFPDDFVFFGSTTEVRRQIGNAVPPVGVHAVADALMPLFTGDYEPVDLYAEQERLSRLSIEERVKLF